MSGGTGGGSGNATSDLIKTVRQTIGALSSAVLCGEPLTAKLDDSRADAYAALDRLAVLWSVRGQYASVAIAARRMDEALTEAFGEPGTTDNFDYAHQTLRGALAALSASPAETEKT